MRYCWKAAVMAATVLLSSSIVFAAALHIGDRGEEVRQVQVMLAAKGYLAGEADGIFGEATKSAVEKFQREHNLEVDGIVGSQTLELLREQNQSDRGQDAHNSANPATKQETPTAGGVMKKGSRGDGVQEVQTLLIEKGYLNDVADGVFGEATKSAVEEFQRRHRLEVDGIVGSRTLALLRETQANDGERSSTESENSAAKQGTATGASVRLGEYVPIGGVVKKGSYGDGVREVQELLIEKGYLTGVADGVCGDMTVHAIRGFQSDAHLTVDGVAGGETYAALHGKTQATDSHGGRVVFVQATAYSAYDPGNSGHTATGKALRHGMIAVDPNFIPLGTRVYIPGYGEAVAEDIGTDIRYNRIDIAFDSREEALAFGRQDLELYILD